MTTKHILASWKINGKGAVRVHEPETGKTVKEFKEVPTCLYGAIRQVSATQFAVCCDDRVVCLCNVDDGSVVQTFSGHNRNGRGLEHIQGPNLLASGTAGGELFLWDLNPEAEEKKRGELKGHTSWICHLINPKSLSHLLLSAGGSCKTARVWDWGREECLKVIDDHPTDVHALAFSGEGSVMMTGGYDKRVLMWDLKNNYGSIGQIGPLPSAVTQLFYRESSHRLSVVANHGVVRVYDIRNISTPLLQFNVTKTSLWGCDVPDQDLLCLTGLGQSMSAWKDDGSVEWRFPAMARNTSYAVCRFGADSDSGGVEFLPQIIDGSVDAIVEAVESRMIPVVTLKGTDGSVVRVPRSMCAREVLDETLHVGMNLEVLQEKDLLAVLTGKKIAADTTTSTLLVLGRLFQALHLQTHLYLLCQFVQKISDPVRVASLALSRDDLVAKLEDWEGEKGDELEGLDVISEAILRALIRLDWTTMPVVKAFRQTSSSLSVFGMCHFVTAPARPLSDHPDLSDLDDSGKACEGFAKLFDRASAELCESRRCTNAALTTSDGGKEEVHVEILLSRSSFFHQMLSFGGAELESMKKTKTILLENFTSDELSAYVSWIYLGSYPKSISFRILVRLLTHFHMHGETTAENSALRGCLDRIRALEGQELILRLLENGHLIMNSLPEDLQTRLVSCAAHRLGFGDEAVRSYLSFADDLGSRVDEAHAKVEDQAAEIDQLTSQVGRQASQVGRQASQIDQQASENEALRYELSGCVCHKRRRSKEDGSEGDGDDLEGASESADSKEANRKKRRKLNPD